MAPANRGKCSINGQGRKFAVRDVLLPQHDCLCLLVLREGRYHRVLAMKCHHVFHIFTHRIICFDGLSLNHNSNNCTNYFDLWFKHFRLSSPLTASSQCGSLFGSNAILLVHASVIHESITSCSDMRPVTDATGIRCLNCPGRSEVALRVFMRPLCQDCTRIVLDLERVRPGPPDKDISRPYLMFTENATADHLAYAAQSARMGVRSSMR